MAHLAPSEVVRMFGGVARSNEIGCLVTREQVDEELATGKLTRLRRGTYALGDLDDVRSLAQRHAGTVSHLSAAIDHGWKVKHPPTRPTITLPRNRSHPGDAMEVHWQDLRVTEVCRGVTRPLATVVACARSYDFDVALSVADSALRERAVTRRELVAAAQASPRTGRARACRVARAADGRAANPFESCARAIAYDVRGLALRPQEQVPGVGRVDLADLALGIVVECESLEFHSDRRSLENDVRRYTACARRGLAVVRFTWREVMFDAD